MNQNEPKPHYRLLVGIVAFLFITLVIATSWNRINVENRPQEPDWATVNKIDTLHSQIDERH